MKAQAPESSSIPPSVSTLIPPAPPVVVLLFPEDELWLAVAPGFGSVSAAAQPHQAAARVARVSVTKKDFLLLIRRLIEAPQLTRMSSM
jgi:hypothetical protein